MENRIKSIRKILDDKNLDAILITSAQNKRYVKALHRSGVKVLITNDNVYEIMDGRYINEAKRNNLGFEIVEFSQGESYFNKVESLLGSKNKLAIESNDFSVNQYLNLEKYNLEISFLTNELETIRIKKDEEEISLIKKACEITDFIFNKALNEIHLGMKEYELSAILQYLALVNEAESMAFDTIVASGVRSSMPHGRPSDKEFEDGDFITIDFGITYKGYQSDMTRTVCLGEPSDKMVEIYQVVKKAQESGIEFISEGKMAKDVDKHVRDIIKSFGYGDYFTHGLGHGIGLGGSELPLLNKSSNTILENGMIMSCEPGIYIPNLGGVRIEDDVLIENGNGIALNQTKKDLIILEAK